MLPEFHDQLQKYSIIIIVLAAVISRSADSKPKVLPLLIIVILFSLFPSRQFFLLGRTLDSQGYQWLISHFPPSADDGGGCGKT